MFSVKEEGTRRIDIMPYEVTVDHNPYADKGELHFERTFYVHRDIGSDKKIVVCPNKTWGKKCPVCEFRETLRDDPEMEDFAKTLWPRERQLWNVWDLDAPDKGVQIWDVSFRLFGELLDQRVNDRDDDEPFHLFADLEEGLSLKLGCKEKNAGTFSFHEVKTIDFKKRKEQYGEEGLEKSHNLDEVLKEIPYNELKRMLHGGIEVAEDEVEVDGDEDEQDEDAPQTRRKKPGTKKKPTGKKKKPEPEPEEDDDDDDEDWDDDDGDDDDDDDSSDDDGDDDEEWDEDEGDDDEDEDEDDGGEEDEKAEKAEKADDDDEEDDDDDDDDDEEDDDEEEEDDWDEDD